MRYLWSTLERNLLTNQLSHSSARRAERVLYRHYRRAHLKAQAQLDEMFEVLVSVNALAMAEQIHATQVHLYEMHFDLQDRLNIKRKGSK